MGLIGAVADGGWRKETYMGVVPAAVAEEHWGRMEHTRVAAAVVAEGHWGRLAHTVVAPAVVECRRCSLAYTRIEAVPEGSRWRGLA